MFWWNSRKRIGEIEEKTQEGFSNVKRDMDGLIKWIKHLDKEDKQVFDLISILKNDLSSLKDEVESLRESLQEVSYSSLDKQVFKKLPVLSKQTGVDDVQKLVQTAVQTDNIYNILKNLSGNEKLVVFTLMNSDMKLSYEDLALLLGKERSTVRGQINGIKQKSEGLIQEISEKNGKKRVFVSEDLKEKLQKYAKVRVEKRRRKN